MLLNLIYNLDFFRSPLNLYFDKRKQQSTNIGVIFSLAMAFFFCLIFSQSDVFYKRSPYVIVQSLASSHAQEIKFNENKLMTLAISDANKVSLLDLTYFNITFEVFHLRVNKSGIFEIIDVKSLALKVCEEYDFPFDKTLYKSLGLINSLCLVNKSFKIEGYWDENELIYAKAQVLPCMNSSLYNNCKSNEEIRKYFQNALFFGATFHSGTADLNNYKKPLISKQENLYQLIDYDYRKRIIISMKSNVLITDDGLILEEMNRESDFSRDSFTTDFVRRTSDEALSQIFFYASHNYQENKRKYQKIPDALAQVAGMFHFLKFLLFFITQIKIYLESMLIVINNRYYFPKKRKIEKKNRKKWKKNKNNSNVSKEINLTITKNDSINIQMDKYLASTNKNLENKNIESNKENSKEKQNIFNISEPTNQNANQKNACSNAANAINLKKNETLKIVPVKNEDEFILEHFSQVPSLTNDFEDNKKNKNLSSIRLKISQHLPNKNEKLTIGYFEFLFFSIKKLICPKKLSKKQRIISKSEKLYKKEMDMMFIMNKIHEIDKIKQVIFNENQLIFFDSLGKDAFVLDEDKEKTQKMVCSLDKKRISEDKIVERKGNKLETALISIKSQENFSDVNKRLLDLLKKKKLLC